MKGLFDDIGRILSESMTVFTHNPMDGKRDLSIWGIVGYVVLPLLLGGFLLYKGYGIGEELQKAILPILTLFVALVFQVIYIAADKFAKRVNDRIPKNGAQDENKDVSLHQDVKNYLVRLGNYTKLFIRQLVLILLISLLIILCYIIMLLNICVLQSVVSSVIIVSFYYWLLLMLKAVVSIYTLLMDDIREQHNLIRNKGKKVPIKGSNIKSSN